MKTENELNPHRHVLKTWPEYFNELLTGAKTFEARKDDRNFQTGDELVLREYEAKNFYFTGREVTRHVTYILRGPAFGIEEGWCVLALSSPSLAEAEKEVTASVRSSRICPDCNNLISAQLDRCGDEARLNWLEMDGNIDKVHCDAMNGAGVFFVDNHESRIGLREAIDAAMLSPATKQPDEANPAEISFNPRRIHLKK